VLAAPTNWNESKEVRAEQGENDAGVSVFLAAALLLQLIADASTGPTNPAASRRAGDVQERLAHAWCVAIERHSGNPSRDYGNAVH
jgi:hypothetical protein